MAEFIHVRCPECHRKNLATAETCVHCGASLADGADVLPPPAAAPRPAASAPAPPAPRRPTFLPVGLFTGTDGLRAAQAAVERYADRQAPDDAEVRRRFIDNEREIREQARWRGFAYLFIFWPLALCAVTWLMQACTGVLGLAHR